MIRFEFNEKKTTQAAAIFIKKSEGKLNYTKMIKLLYIADREALSKWERPISGDSYVAMKHGPVLSNVLDLINYGYYVSSVWYEYISEPTDYNVSLKNDPGDDELSKQEVALLNDVHDTFKKYNQWEMIDICHKNLPEWDDPGNSSNSIRIEDIFNALNKTEREVDIIASEVSSMQFVKKVLTIHE